MMVFIELLLLNIFLILLSRSVLVEGYDSSTLFPDNDEYDVTIINPETMFGTPYGGFSRASSSRLSKLPLILMSGFDEVNIEEESLVGNDEKSSNRYFHISDNDGRQFSCHGYVKDELSLESVYSSVFDMPIESSKTNEDGSEEKEEDEGVAGSRTDEIMRAMKEYFEKFQYTNEKIKVPIILKDFFRELDNFLVDLNVHKFTLDGGVISTVIVTMSLNFIFLQDKKKKRMTVIQMIMMILVMQNIESEGTE